MNDELIQTVMESLDPVRGLSDEALDELFPHDQLMTKISAGVIAKEPTSARAKRAPLRQRIPRLVGSAVAASSVIAALALMVFGSAPALVQTTGTGTKTTVAPPPVLKLGPQPVNSGVADPPQYSFTPDPSLSDAVGTATAYQLTAPSDYASVTSRIATALGISGPVIYLGPDNYQAGPSAGPDVTVGGDSSILLWQYPTWTDQPPGERVPVNDDAPLPTNDQATADGRQLLLSMGVSASQLGAPTISRAPEAVDVSFPMVVNGIVTDQYSEIGYGFGATVLTAQGVIATAIPSNSYPTISPAQAAMMLTPNGSATYGNSKIASTESASNLVNVDINRATLGLATYILTNQTSWLLPTWMLSGPQTGSSLASDSTFGGNVLAISPQFVHVEPNVSG